MLTRLLLVEALLVLLIVPVRADVASTYMVGANFEPGGFVGYAPPGKAAP